MFLCGHCQAKLLRPRVGAAVVCGCKPTIWKEPGANSRGESPIPLLGRYYALMGILPECEGVTVQAHRRKLCLCLHRALGLTLQLTYKDQMLPLYRKG